MLSCDKFFSVYLFLCECMCEIGNRWVDVLACVLTFGMVGFGGSRFKANC